MKKKSVTIYKATATLITATALATLLQGGISFAGNNYQEIKNGTIRVHQSESEYPGLAKITMNQARDIALANVEGDLLKNELKEEDGFLVYAIEIVSSDKQITEVTVDAGNGEILQVGKDNPDKDNPDNDHEEREHETED